MNDHNIDGHKLHYHPERVSEWMAGKTGYPVYIEISPINACNHSCTFCALDHVRSEYSSIDTRLLEERITEIAELGVKSVMYAGEGEPLLHPDIIRILSVTRSSNIDAAITTNGTGLDKIDIEELLASLSWLRISINAGNAAAYAQIHNCDTSDFDKVISNLRRTVSVRDKSGLKSTVGVQFLLLPENRESLSDLIKTVRDTGADYVIVKPYCEHLLNTKSRYNSIDYTDFIALDDELKSLSSEDCRVIFRRKSIEKSKLPREYDACCGLDFFSYIDSRGNLYPCQAFIGDDRYIMGNIHEARFEQIWNSKQRASVLELVASEFPSKCRRLCRLDEINKYLWKLKNPDKHINFI